MPTETLTLVAVNNESWLDIIPAIPLARGVPVRKGQRTGVVCVVIRGRREQGGEGCEVAWHDAEHDTTGFGLHDSIHLRVDLDDPQGFAYALRFLLQRVAAGEHSYRRAYQIAHSLMDDHAILRGQVTVRDRLRLAHALRMVV